MHPDILLLLDKPHPAASSSFLRNSGPGPQRVALGDLTRGVQGRAKGCMQPWGGVTVRNQPSPCASMFEPQGKTYQEPLTSLSVSLPLSVSVSPLLQHPGSFLSLSAHTCVHMHTPLLSHSSKTYMSPLRQVGTRRGQLSCEPVCLLCEVVFPPPCRASCGDRLVPSAQVPV